MDPATALTLISQTLGLLDTFRNTVYRWKGETPKEPSVTAGVERGKFVIRASEGGRAQVINGPELDLSPIDADRLQTLHDKLVLQMRMINELDRKSVLASADEEARLKLVMEEKRKPLCADFREFRMISEKVLKVPLSDHYALNHACGEC